VKSRWWSALGRIGRGFALVAVAAVLLLMLTALLEGAAGLIQTARLLPQVLSPLLERSHTRYDPLLGWSHVPGIAIPDLYGPGRHLSVNAQGLRGSVEYALEPAAGTTRIVCSGDSFTLGYGVSDDQTWCHRLGQLDPAIESLNLGQGGYGLDQMVLLFMRDGRRFRHHVHVVAFITEDVERMRYDRFLGYAKPRLELRGGELAVENVPVPERSLWMPRISQATVALKSLHLYRALFGPPAEGDPSSPAARDVYGLAIAVLERLAAESRASGSRLVVVHLPTATDHADHRSDLARHFLARECERRSIDYVDLVEEVRRMPATDAASLFDVHYTPAGHAFVAEHLQAKLCELGVHCARAARADDSPGHSATTADPRGLDPTAAPDRP
jgi:hypothetical protein